MRFASFARLVVLVCLTAFASICAWGGELRTIDDVLKAYASTLVRTENLSEEVRAELKGKPELINPGFVKLDFDGDGKLDVALLTQDVKREEVVLRLFICSDICSEKKKELVGAMGDVFLTRARPGTLVRESDALPGRSGKLRLRFHAVRVQNFGKSEIVYYWDSRTMSLRSMQTAD